MGLIGSKVRVLRHPEMADIKKKSPASYHMVIGVCVLLVVLLIGVESSVLPDTWRKLRAGDWSHLTRVDWDLLAMIAITLGALPFLPSLLKLQARQKSQRLLVGELGMQMTQEADPGLAAQSSPPILWTDVKQAQLVYRRVDGMNVGVRITTRSGRQLFLSALRWMDDDAAHAKLLLTSQRSLTLGLAKDKYAMLKGSDLVKTLEAQGLAIQDEPAYLWDKVALILGLSLTIIVAILALVAVYLHWLS